MTDHLAHMVAIVEVTVDHGRDSPRAPAGLGRAHRRQLASPGRRAGHERLIAAGRVRGASMTPAPRTLLDPDGVDDLDHPGGGSRTIDQALGAIGWVLGQNLSEAHPG
jgi:hypothetical protein